MPSDGDDESYLVFPAVWDASEGTPIAGPAQDDAEGSRATAQHPSSSVLPTLLQRIEDSRRALQQHHRRLCTGTGSIEDALRSCEEARQLLKLTAACEGCDMTRDSLSADLAQLARLLETLAI
jgi:hypothetical protein